MRALDWGGIDPLGFGHRYLGLSGGKDSVATGADMKAAGIDFEAIYADTGWEVCDCTACGAYRDPVGVCHACGSDTEPRNLVLEHAKLATSILGVALHVVKAPQTMVDLIRAGRGMPRISMSRWCTRELKVAVKLAFLRERHGDDMADVLDVIGIRAQESAQRRDLPRLEVDKRTQLTVARPIMDYLVEDTLAAHHDAGIPVNPLYRKGLNRVGCWPCVHATKEEIAVISRVDPRRLALIGELEDAVAAYRPLHGGNVEVPEKATEVEVEAAATAWGGSIDDARAALTASRQAAIEAKERMDRALARGAKGPTFFSIGRTFAPIDYVAKWANTKRGGRQLEILDLPTDGGCMRWGMCDAPDRDTPGEAT